VQAALREMWPGGHLGGHRGEGWSCAGCFTEQHHNTRTICSHFDSHCAAWACAGCCHMPFYTHTAPIRCLTPTPSRSFYVMHCQPNGIPSESQASYINHIDVPKSADTESCEPNAAQSLRVIPDKHFLDVLNTTQLVLEEVRRWLEPPESQPTCILLPQGTARGSHPKPPNPPYPHSWTRSGSVRPGARAASPALARRSSVSRRRARPAPTSSAWYMH
jgi:hypothetical protein